jgi:pyridoxamine 5'-phosphate oxidase
VSAPLSSAPWWDTVVEWLPANDDIDRPQIQVATVDPDGAPDIRTVLLTEFTDDGFYFHTDSRSRKVADIAAEPRVAIEILWPGFTRQLAIQGVASVASVAEQAAAFARRSPYLKQLAWQNSVEFAQLPAAEREAQWAEFAASHDVETIEPSPTWIGFVVRPTRLTFWESNSLAASRRTEYRLDGGDWRVTYLAG